jgi:hypothetical protein
MGKVKVSFISSISLILIIAVAGTGEARKYQTWCKSFSTGENIACSTHTEYGGTYSYTPSVAPMIYNAPDNTLFNVKYEAADHEKALFSMFLDPQISSCVKGTDCNFSAGKWETHCVWNNVDSWVCTIYYQEAQINQYYLLADYVVRNYRYLSLAGNKNSAPLITDVPAMSFAENAGLLSNIVDLWFYAGDDRTPKQNLSYAVTSQTNPGVVSCAVASNRYINCSTQPSANGFSDITFSVKDASGATTSSTFRITITAANPTAPTPAPTQNTLMIPSTPERDTPAPETPAETPSETPG